MSNQFGASALELSSHKVLAGNRIYFLDRKKTKDTGDLFLKIKEKSNKKQSVIIIEMSMIPSLIESLKEGLGPQPYSKMPESYAKLVSSPAFDDKTLEIFARENERGQYLNLKESYDKGIRSGISTHIMIASEYLRQFISTLEIVSKEAGC